MGFLDNAKAKLAKAADDHGDKIAGGIDKASAAIDKRTGGKHSDKIATGSAKARDALEKHRGRNDDVPPAPPTDPSNPTGSPRPEDV